MAAIFGSFIGTKIYLSYACIMAAPQGDQFLIVAKTCDYMGDLELPSSNPIAYEYIMLFRDSDPVCVFLALLICWMILFLIVALGIPQISSAWDLLRSTCWSKQAGKNGIELSIVRTWRHQNIQNLMIIMELVIVTACALVAIIAKDGTDLTAVELIMCITTKVLFVRVICAFFVELYFHEQLLAIIMPGVACDFALPKPIQEILDKKRKT